MLSTSAPRRLSSRLMSPTDSEPDNSSTFVPQPASSPPGSSNAFFQAPIQQHHSIFDNPLPKTRRKKSNVNFLQAGFSDSPVQLQTDLNSHSHHENSSSTLQLTPSSQFSCFHSQDSFALVSPSQTATLSALSPFPASARFTHRTVHTTPDRLGSIASSSTPAWCKPLNENPLSHLNITPFQLFQEIDLPPLFDLNSSPVVRRSLGDVTPVYSSQNNHIIDQSAPRGVFRETSEDHGDRSDEMDRRSPSSPQKKQNTPFLQKLRRSPRFMQKQDIFYPHTPAPKPSSLASPFAIKDRLVLARDSDSPSYPLTSPPAQGLSTPDGTKLNLSAHKPPSGHGFSYSTASSPLSELPSTPAHSPFPFDLKAAFEKEDRKHRMKTRSAARDESTIEPRAITLVKRVLKRKSTDSKNALVPTSTDHTRGADELATPPSSKKRKLLKEPTSPALRPTRWIMSRGAGPGIFSSKARSKKNVAALTQVSSNDPTTFSPQVLAHETEFSSSKTSLFRQFPSSIPINQSYPKFYVKFHLCSFFNPGGVSHSILIDRENAPKPPKGHARPNSARSAYDLYTPRFTKGVGTSKQGLCPICFEPVERGGVDRQEWFFMKYSAYKCYHMQYFHGISSVTGQPFSPPTEFRTHRRTQVRSQEKEDVLEGKCHKCRKWVPVEGVKIGNVNVKELFWWKHAASCHKNSRLPGDTNVFVEDEVSRRLKAYEADSAAAAREVTEGG